MVVIGLGSNIDNRTFYLQQAIEMLSGVYHEPILTNIRLSPIYETPALLLDDAPESWNMPYLNMALAGDTTLSPDELLSKTQRLEVLIGRERRGEWGPREIDIDILAYDDLVIQTDTLVIPHSELLNRDFALVPFSDLCPRWEYPIKGDLEGVSAETIVELKEYRDKIIMTNISLALHV